MNLPSLLETCPQCDGVGRIEAAFPTDAAGDNTPKMLSAPCPGCGGQGQVLTTAGKGLVERPDQIKGRIKK